MKKEEKKAIEKIEDFMSSNVIVCLGDDKTADYEQFKVFISKNEYLAIDYIVRQFIKEKNKKHEKLYSKEEIENVINKSVCDYGCLRDNLYVMLGYKLGGEE